MILAAIFFMVPGAIGFGYATYEGFMKFGIIGALVPGFGTAWCVACFFFFLKEGMEPDSPLNV